MLEETPQLKAGRKAHSTALRAKAIPTAIMDMLIDGKTIAVLLTMTMAIHMSTMEGINNMRSISIRNS